MQIKRKVISCNTFVHFNFTLFDFNPITHVVVFCSDLVVGLYLEGQPPDTRQDLTGLFTEKPQSGEVTVGEWLQIQDTICL